MMALPSAIDICKGVPSTCSLLLRGVFQLGVVEPWGHWFSGELTRRGKPTTRKRGVLQTPRTLCDKLNSALYSTVRSLCGLSSVQPFVRWREKVIIIHTDSCIAQLVEPSPLTTIIETTAE